MSHQATEVFEQGTRYAARIVGGRCSRVVLFNLPHPDLFRERRNLPRWGYARISRRCIKKDGRPKLLAYVAGTFIPVILIRMLDQGSRSAYYQDLDAVGFDSGVN